MIQPNPNSDSIISLKSQVVLDVESYLSQFPNRSFAMKSLSKDSGLTQKTIRRLLKKENNPSNLTLYRLYKTMVGVEKREELLQSVPEVIQRKLNELSLDKFEKETSKEFNFAEILKSDPILSEIYLQLGVGIVDLGAIIYQYGQYGAKAVEKLVDLNIAKSVDDNLYTLCSKQPFLCSETLKTIGQRMVHSFFDSSKTSILGENFIGLYAEKLNKQGKNKWLEIDKKAFSEKMKVADLEEFRGEEAVFCFQAIDSFAPKGPLLQ